MARQKALFSLARMNVNTSMALSMRARCVEWTRSVPVPGQATSLSLQQGSTDQVSLLACTSLISQPQLEKTATAWVRSTSELTSEGWGQKL